MNIDLVEAWQKARRDELTPSDVCNIIADKLKALTGNERLRKDQDLRNLIERFEFSGSITTDYYNLFALYDDLEFWANANNIQLIIK